jgi:hypothetical protein
MPCEDGGHQQRAIEVMYLPFQSGLKWLVKNEIPNSCMMIVTNCMAIYKKQSTKRGGGLNTDLFLPVGFETAKHVVSNPQVTHPISIQVFTQEATNQPNKQPNKQPLLINMAAPTINGISVWNLWRVHQQH